MTNTITDMMNSYPAGINTDRQQLADGVATLLECAQACTACADACLSEKNVVELAKCIRTSLDCADVCGTAARELSRHTCYDANLTRAVLQACAQDCQSCGTECDLQSSMHEHCRICAEVCQRCALVCNRLLATMG